MRFFGPVFETTQAIQILERGVWAVRRIHQISLFKIYEMWWIKWSLDACVVMAFEYKNPAHIQKNFFYKCCTSCQQFNCDISTVSNQIIGIISNCALLLLLFQFGWGMFAIYVTSLGGGELWLPKTLRNAMFGTGAEVSLLFFKRCM